MTILLYTVFVCIALWLGGGFIWSAAVGDVPSAVVNGVLCLLACAGVRRFAAPKNEEPPRPPI